MKRTLALVSVCALLATACGNDEKTIIEVVQKSQKAGYAYDFATYISMWTDDASITWSRLETADPGTDLVLDRTAIEASRRLRFTGKPPAGNLSFENPKVEVDGDTAVLKTITITSSKQNTQRVGEEYGLVKTADGWKVKTNRFWILSSRYGTDIRLNSSGRFAELDEKVAVARKGGSSRELFWALNDAMRWREAFAASKHVTAKTDATADDWMGRAYTAVTVGDAKDALESVRRARALKPDVRLPKWAPKNPESL